MNRSALLLCGECSCLCRRES